jgi:uncharacterized protein (DUF1684 family)
VSLTLLDYRRRTHALYAQVREVATRDPAEAHARWREGRGDLFAHHPDSPSHEAVLRYAPYDPAFRFEVEVDVSGEGERIHLPRSGEGTMGAARVGRVHLPIGDLDLWWLDDYGGGLFVPLRDATAGDTTYGGGRYLLDTAKGADLGGGDGSLVVDCNFAYHPSCYYDPIWSCPLAPPGNRIGSRVDAGELAATS